MTLKSLNTRYLKLSRKMTAAVVLLLITVSPLSMTRWSAKATGLNLRPAEADNSIPALQGTAAITYLKEHKLYDSLRAAVNVARTQQIDNSLLAPLFIEEQKLTASDGAAGDFFGTSVAVSGSTIVVGAPFDSIGGNLLQGSAYVFNRQGGNWVEEQKLTVSDGAAGDQFGQSVAVSGSTIVVGAWLDDINGNVDQGSAYVFNRQGRGWVEEQKLTASDGAASDRFGWSVAASGSTFVVAAMADNSLQGSAYVFNRQGGSWLEEQKLTASDGAPGDRFGWSIAISGSTIVVGTAITTIFFEGSAYVFNRQGDGWVQTQKLTASDGAGGNIFGWSVAISGSTIVVGALGTNVETNLDQGSAYVFNRQGESWVETQKLTASDGAPFDEFGWTVAISGSTIVVSSELEAIGGNTTQGFAYVFNRQGGNWVETQKLIASDGEPHDRFGWSIAVSGPTVVLGALGDNSFQGSAYVFEP
jgi:FG-GAP repeat protein